MERPNTPAFFRARGLEPVRRARSRPAESIPVNEELWENRSEDFRTFRANTGWHQDLLLSACSEDQKAVIFSEDMEALEAVFFGLKPLAIINDYPIDNSIAQRFGLLAVTNNKLNFVFDPKLVQELCRKYPEYFDKHKALSELILDKASDQDAQKSYALGLLLGYPEEACKGFAMLKSMNQRVEQALLKFGFLEKELRAGESFDLVKIGTEVVNKAKQNKLKYTGLLFDLRDLLELKLQALNSLERIAGPGVLWVPYGEVTSETNSLAENLRKAFKSSKFIAYDGRSPQMKKGHKVWIHAYSKILNQINTLTFGMTGRSY